jgi:hypothetical protein
MLFGCPIESHVIKFDKGDPFHPDICYIAIREAVRRLMVYIQIASFTPRSQSSDPRRRSSSEGGSCGDLARISKG